MARLNWQQRQGPQDFDDTAPTDTPLDFDYTHAGGVEPWPARHGTMKFGPSLIKKAWAAGLVVVAEIEGFPYPVAVTDSHWFDSIFEVKTLEGWKIPKRIWTRPDAKNLTSSGLLME